MEGDELAAWQRRHRYSDAKAAALLGLSPTTLWRQKNGRARVSRQTELLAAYVTIFDRAWLDIAETALKLSRMHAEAR